MSNDVDDEAERRWMEAKWSKTPGRFRDEDRRAATPAPAAWKRYGG